MLFICLFGIFVIIYTPHQYLENIIKALLHKAGESNMFIREDVEKSLHIMMQHTHPSKAFTALISGGIGLGYISK